MQDLITFINLHPLLSFATLFIIILILIVEWIRAKQKTVSITPTEAVQLINRENATVFDIRPPDAYHKSHIIDAQLSTEQTLREASKKIEKFKSKPLIIVCQQGHVSQKLAALLLKQGYNTFSLAGGMNAWQLAGMPTVNNKTKQSEE